MFDYKLIEAMAMVVREEGFDNAARKLNITQSAVSQRIKLLEDMCGQLLIARSTPPSATPAGNRLLKHYMQVKRLEEDLQGAFQQDFSVSPPSLAIGVNADSLATWFQPAIESFLNGQTVTLDLKVDDQEETHKMLRDGDVAGCISSRKTSFQGCSISYLGTMTYRLAATPEFVDHYFRGGVDVTSIMFAPAVIFNRKDKLHNTLLKKILGKEKKDIPAHYVPSTETFAEYIIKGVAYGMIPDLQSSGLFESGKLIDLFPKHPVEVKLYWHCWNLKSELLETFSNHLIKNSEIF